jgi:hypothetical protein
MAMWIIAAALAAVVMGYSPVPVFAIGTVAIVVVAYHLSRRAALLRLGAAFLFFVLGHFMIGRVSPVLLARGATDLELSVLRVVTSDGLVLAMAGGVMLTSIAIGTLHAARRTPGQAQRK